MTVYLCVVVAFVFIFMEHKSFALIITIVVPSGSLQTISFLCDVISCLV